MGKRGVRRSRRNYSRIARIAILLGIIAVYTAYWVLTPSTVLVPQIASTSDALVLRVTLHNPTLKIVTGKIYRVDAEIDVPTGHGGSAPLQSVPRDYPFILLPHTSADLDVQMIYRNFPGYQYNVWLQIDGVGQTTVTLVLPQT